MLFGDNPKLNKKQFIEAILPKPTMLALFKDGMEFLEDGLDEIEGKEKEPEPEIPKL